MIVVIARLQIRHLAASRALLRASEDVPREVPGGNHGRSAGREDLHVLRLWPRGRREHPLHSRRGRRLLSKVEGVFTFD